MVKITNVSYLKDYSPNLLIMLISASSAIKTPLSVFSWISTLIIFFKFSGVKS